MKKETYSFTVNSLYYRKIEQNILKHYNLGWGNSSNLPVRLNKEDSGEYYITGTKASMKFYLEIKTIDDNSYQLTCYPQ